MVTGFFMFGFDNDTLDIFDETLQTMYEWDLDGASFSIMTPYPGTRLFDRLEKEGRITSYDWSRYTEGNVAFKPKNISEEELLQGIRRIAREYYSIPNSIKRIFRGDDLNFYHFLNKLGRNLSARKFYKEKLNI
jgi:radical SAM superfamily enzyme YgiQ (UPF0313 family)